MEYTSNQLPFLLICKTAIYEHKPLIQVFQDIDGLMNQQLTLDERNTYKRILSQIWVMEVEQYEIRFNKTWKQSEIYNNPEYDK